MPARQVRPFPTLLASLVLPALAFLAPPAMAQNAPDGLAVGRSDPDIREPVPEGRDWRPHLPSRDAVSEQPDPFPPDVDPSPRRQGSIVAPRADEPGPGPASWDALADDTKVPARPGGRTLPPSVSRSAPGASQGWSLEGPMVFPAPTEPPPPEDMPAGVDASCTALTDPVARDRCRRGSTTLTTQP